MQFFARVAAALTVALAFIGCAAAQQAYPGKPIRFIVPYPPGGTTNLMSRLIGQKLTESFGQPVIIDNRPGGNTIIGTEALAKSKPDGYTILLTSSIHVITPLLIPTPYDPIKDFAPITTTTITEQLLVVHPSVPADTLQELIALAKSRPGQLNYATATGGGPTHLAAELLSIMTGIKLQHIPYKGGAQVVTDLIGGQVQMAFQSPIAVVAHIKNGRLKGIAVSGAVRLAALPQMPTFTEAGLPGFDVKYWQGVFAPAGTPEEIINWLSVEIAKIMRATDVREKLVAQGLDPFTSIPAQFVALVKADLASYAKIIKTANIKADQ